MPTGLQRTVAVLCYVGAMRVPLVALVLPDWAFTVPSGLLVAGAAWLYGRRRSSFLLHHARAGFAWSLQTNVLLAAIALISSGFHSLWHLVGLAAFNTLWHFGATAFRWAGVLVSIITIFVMRKAARGSTADALTQATSSTRG